MSIIILAELFSEIFKHKVYAVNFPAYTEGTSIKIEITSGVNEAGGVSDFNVQFMIKAKHPSESERVALDIIDKIDMITDLDFNAGKYQMILIKAISQQPFYIGETETQEFLYSVDFRLLVNKL